MRGGVREPHQQRNIVNLRPLACNSVPLQCPCEFNTNSMRIQCECIANSMRIQCEISRLPLFAHFSNFSHFCHCSDLSQFSHICQNRLSLFSLSCAPSSCKFDAEFNMESCEHMQIQSARRELHQTFASQTGATAQCESKESHLCARFDECTYRCTAQTVHMSMHELRM